jgi:hypothetical protein
MDYYTKYLKYKRKYLALKKIQSIGLVLGNTDADVTTKMSGGNRITDQTPVTPNNTPENTTTELPDIKQNISDTIHLGKTLMKGLLSENSDSD